MPPALRSERLRLHPLAPADRLALHRLWTHPDVRRFLWDDRVIDLETVDGVIARSEELLATAGYCLFRLEPLDGSAMVGACGLYRFPEREPELIYSLARECWGRGYATEASRVVIRDAFERLGFARVLARTDSPNQASVEVMQRLGMTYVEERLENGQPTVSYALTRAAWEAGL